MVSLLQERPPYVRFEIQTVEGRDENGNPFPMDVERVLITPSGSKDVVVKDVLPWLADIEAKARKSPDPEYNPVWSERFRAQYESWRRGVEMPLEGTPIRSWPALSPSEVKRCLASSVYVVEDLATANANVLHSLGMGANALKQKAIDWLKEKEGPGALLGKVTTLERDNAALAEKNQELEGMVRDLMTRVDALTPNKPTRKSRLDNPQGSPDLQIG